MFHLNIPTFTANIILPQFAAKHILFIFLGKTRFLTNIFEINISNEISN